MRIYNILFFTSAPSASEKSAVKTNRQVSIQVQTVDNIK